MSFCRALRRELNRIFVAITQRDALKRKKKLHTKKSPDEYNMIITDCTSGIKINHKVKLYQSRNYTIGHVVIKDNLYRTKYGQYSFKAMDAAVYSLKKAQRISSNEDGTEVRKLQKIAFEIKDIGRGY